MRQAGRELSELSELTELCGFSTEQKRIALQRQRPEILAMPFS